MLNNQEFKQNLEITEAIILSNIYYENNLSDK